MNKSDPKVTIVVPVYNAEKYLEKCLVSIENQIFSQIEIICVNDGSTDCSREILKIHQEKDRRIRIIDQHNKGYGSAVNAGFMSANGEYVGIVEPDDYISEKMIKILYGRMMKYDLDMISSDYVCFWEKEKRFIKKHIISNEDTYNKVLNTKTCTDLLKGDFINPAGLFKKTFLQKYHILHHETPGASFQDRGFCILALAYGERIMILSDSLYFYRHDNPDSSITSPNNLSAVAREYQMLLNEIMEARTELDYIIPEVIRRMYGSMRYAFIRTDERYKKTALYEMRKIFLEYFNYPDRYLKEFSKEWRDEIKYFILKPEEFYDDYMSLKQEIHELVSEYGEFYIFGAGEMARRIFFSVGKDDQKYFLGFIVSSMKDNPSSLFGHSVMSFLEEKLKYDVPIVFGVASLSSRDELKKELTRCGFRHIYQTRSIATRM